LLVQGSGQEVIRGTFGQRFYFRDQLVQLSSSTAARTYRSSDYMAALSGRFSRAWTADTGIQYNPRESRPERLSVGARYQPGQYQTLSASYRFMRDQFNQVEFAGQWPLMQSWFGVGKMNYSIRDGRALETIIGAEYKADCWVFRGVVQSFSISGWSSAIANTGVYLQIELSGLANIGSNPLEVLRRNIPGYGRLNQIAPPINPAYDFFD
jgi:LPS-assembly protein